MSTTSAAVPTTSSGTTCAANLYDTPVRDIACAMPYSDDNIDRLKKCCKGADVVSYYDDCGLYCLALEQSAEDLTDCLYDEGAKYQDVFCRDGGDASATATGDTKPLESADTTVVSGSGKKGDDDDDDDDDSDSDSDSSGSKKGSSDDDEDDDSPAAITRPQGHTTLAGVVVGTLLFLAPAFGAVLI